MTPRSPYALHAKTQKGTIPLATKQDALAGRLTMQVLFLENIQMKLVIMKKGSAQNTGVKFTKV